MRRAARLLATAVVLCSALSCRDKPSCNRCGVAVIVMGADADALLPPFVRSGQGLAVSDLIYLKLADIGLKLNTVGDAEFQPRLARSWKFEDSLTLVFDLDPRARWHDGVPVTGSDVAFTFDIFRDSVINANARPLLAEIASVTARDEHTAVFRFRRTYSEQFYDATYHMRVLPRHLLDSISRAKLESHPLARSPMGDGPYRFVSWKAKESIELVADTAFFLGRPGINRVVLRPAADVSAALTQITANQADILDYIGGPDEVARVMGTSQFNVVTRPSSAYIYLGFNLHDPKAPGRAHPLFGDRELRRAIFQGIDRKTINHALMGDYGPIPVGPLSRLTPLGNDSTIPQLAYDSAQAAAALDKLGWKDSNGDGIRDRNGRALAFDLLVPTSSPNRVRAAILIQDQLKRLGVSVKQIPYEFNILQNLIGHHNFDAAMLNWGEDPSPSGIRQVWVTSAYREANYGGYSNPKFDQLVSQATNARDTATAHATWREAYALINDDAPAVWLYAPVQPTAIHKRYENVTIAPDQWLATLWTWRVPDDRMIDRDRFGSATGSP